MGEPPKQPTIEQDGWALISAEDRHAANPETFWIPPRSEREALEAGDAVRLLFDIETKEGGRVIDRGVDRMWVVVKAPVEDGYLGVLGNDPGAAENLTLREGDLVYFRPEHVASKDLAPRDYIVEKYGASFFED